MFEMRILVMFELRHISGVRVNISDCSTPQNISDVRV